MASKKSLEDLCGEFIEMWDAYWNSGALEGPKHSDLVKLLNKVRAKIQSNPE